MDTELALALMGIGGTAIGAVATYFGVRRKAESNEKVAETAKDEKQLLADAKAAERTEDRLWQRLEAVEAETKQCHEDRERDRERYARALVRAGEECDERVRSVETDLRKLAARIIEQRKSMTHLPPPDFADDDTGLHELETIANGTSSPPPGTITMEQVLEAMRVMDDDQGAT